MLLAIDVGNSHTVIGLFQEDDLLTHWRLSTNRFYTSDDLAVSLNSLFALRDFSLEMITGVIIGSVVPSLKKSWRDLARQYTNLVPIEVGTHLDTGITIVTENPEEVGADRIINSVAAYELYRQNLIVVDFGTAITFDCVSQKAEYLGGAIAPGPQISSDALARETAKLPLTELNHSPSRVIGDTTIKAIQSGLFYGFTGLVNGVVEKMITEFSEKPKVIATGGMAEIIAPYTRVVDSLEPMLTLTGLQIIYARTN